VDTVNLLRKALLLDLPANRPEPRFQVATPLAIAAVRGTKWAVDVAAGKTSVFVVRGSVMVQRPAAGSGVVLGSGDGVDVEPGTGPLTVKRWPAARVSALLARFGQ
jgi:ferric-dicitrate binding protein FerR (iron transport regulator)